MKPTSDGGQTLSEWKCSFDGDTARGAAEAAVILHNRIVDLERKVRVLGDAFGIEQPPAEQPVHTDGEIYSQSLATRIGGLQQSLVSANKGNERLSSRVKELEEENASLMAKAEAMTMELESHRARRTGDGALLAEVEELKIKQYDLRDALRDVLSQIEDIRRGVRQALDA